LKGLTSEGLVGAIAERTLLRVLAGAEVDRAVGLSLIRYGREGGAFMAAVAEWLVLTVSTRAPVVGLTGFNEDRERRLLGDMGGGHGRKMTEGR
jgi:NADH:ubiquinone oxidoreductase subunit K